MNFVDEFLEVTATVESPTAFLIWAAYSTIGSVLRDNVYISIPARRTKIYPNLYILLIGESGEARKSNPVKLAKGLVKDINNTKVIAGRTSIEGMISELSMVTTESNSRGTKTLNGAAATIYSEELKSLLVKNPDTSGILTDLYDFHEEWTYLLKNEDKIKLKNVCLSLIAATNKIFLKGMFRDEDIFGGLVGRMIILEELKPRFKNSGMFDEVPEGNVWEELDRHLRYLASLKGTIILTQAAKQTYNDWYVKGKYSEPSSKTGFEARIHTHVLKLAIILAAAEPDWKLLVEESHIIKAIETIVALKPNYRSIAVTGGAVQDPIAMAAKFILEILMHNAIIKNNKTDPTEITRLLLGTCSSDNISKGLEHLQKAHYVTETSSNGKLIYSLTPEGLKLIPQTS